MEIFIITSQFYIVLGSLYTIRSGFLKSKKPLYEVIEGLIPPFLMILYIFVAFAYTSMAWSAPSVVLFVAGTYFCLSVTKMIISTVTKQRCTIFDDLHLSVPFLISIIALPANFYLT